MSAAYIVVGGFTAAANIAFAALDLARSEFVLDNMRAVHVNQSLLYPLGMLKLAGAVGLLVGIGVAPLGAAAAAGLILFFVGAIVIHCRTGQLSTIPYPALMLALAIASLALRLTSD